MLGKSSLTFLRWKLLQFTCVIQSLLFTITETIWGMSQKHMEQGISEKSTTMRPCTQTSPGVFHLPHLHMHSHHRCHLPYLELSRGSPLFMHCSSMAPIDLFPLKDNFPFNGFVARDLVDCGLAGAGSRPSSASD